MNGERWGSKSDRRVAIAALVSAAALLVTAAVLPACGTGGPQIPDELLDCHCDGNGDYPNGPYGAEVGDIIENFSFQGYQAPQDKQSLEEIRFGDYFDPTGDKGVTLLLLNTAAAWCQPCVIEHGELPSRAEKYRDAGLVIVSALFQDSNGSPATESTLKTWANTFDSNFPLLLDPSYQMGRYGPAETPPLNLVIDPRDMSILARFIGYQEEPLWSFIEKELDARSRQ